MIRRKLRLEWMAALGVAILIPAAYAQQTATRATLTVDGSGRATVSVSDVLSHPASGVVSIEEGDRILGEALLDAEGQAQVKLTLASGEHTLRAVYAGDATHQPALFPPSARELIVLQAVRRFAKDANRNPDLAATMQDEYDRAFMKWCLVFRTQFRSGGALGPLTSGIMVPNYPNLWAA